MKTAAIYVRVSTSKKSSDNYVQNPSVQEAPLRELVERAGWKLGKVYSDRISGASRNRPEFKRMMEDARRRQFEVLVVWKFDRFARSLKELVNALDEFRYLEIQFISHTEAIDTATPLGRMLLGVIGSLAEFERSIIQERVQAGLDYAKEHGTRSGKPIGRERRVFDRNRAMELRNAGMPIRHIAALLGVGKGTIERATRPTSLRANGDRSTLGTQGIEDAP